MPAFLHGPPLAKATLTHPRAHTSDALAHITDWLPTLLTLAGGLVDSVWIKYQQLH